MAFGFLFSIKYGKKCKKSEKNCLQSLKTAKYYIQLLLRTLPYSIKEESKRNNPSMDVLRNLTNKYTMVQKLAKEII